MAAPDQARTLPTPPEVVEAIKRASLGETHQGVAERLGVSVPTVRRYRKEAKEQRQEAAREHIAAHVEETVPDALTDLKELRQWAKGNYRNSGDASDGALWLKAIKATLEHVTPDDAELDAAISRELARLAGAEEAPGAGEAAGAG